MNGSSRLGGWVFIAFGLLAFAGSEVPAQEGGEGTAAQGPEVRVDPRVELMCVVFRLAGHPEYQQARIESYAKDVDRHFASFRDHEVVQRARALRASRGVGYDAPMSLAVHLRGLLEMAGTLPTAARPAGLDERWRADEREAFLRAAERFVAESDFAAFLEAHRELYELTERRLRSVLAANLDVQWFERFFGQRARASFRVIPGLLNGPGSYGPRVANPGEPEQIFSVLGVWTTDDEGLPRFEDGIVDTVVHEFCHSFVNPLVDAHLELFEPAATRLFPFVEEVMRQQAYGSWAIVMKESLVRASTVRYVSATRGDAAALRAIAYEEGRGFEWTRALQERLAGYESDRERYPTLEAFVPQVVSFFDDWVEGFVALQEKAPKVLSLTPANGSRDVDPATRAIVVTFDRPMVDGQWSVVGGGPAFPKLEGSPSYDESHTVLTIPVRLEPGHAYEFWLNRGRFQSFRGARDGVALRPVRVAFRTK